MTAQPTLPRKVFRLAMLAGAHADCLVSGSDHACEACSQIIISVFDRLYGHLTEEQIYIAVTRDFEEDIVEDLAGGGDE